MPNSYIPRVTTGDQTIYHIAVKQENSPLSPLSDTVESHGTEMADNSGEYVFLVLRHAATNLVNPSTLAELEQTTARNKRQIELH